MNSPYPDIVSMWLTQFRVLQWIKNILVFIPVIADHKILDREKLIDCCLTFFIFSIVASAIYTINDIVDVKSDKMHYKKKKRPIAAGKISILAAIIASVAFLSLGITLSVFLIPKLIPILATYFFLTLAYSFYFKRKEILDVLLLSAFYVIRIIAGGIVTGITVSFWLLSFSGFFFLSIAFSKRFTELSKSIANGTELNFRRGYDAQSLQSLKILGISSGFNSITIFILYINDPNTLFLYPDNKLLFLLVPILTYWISTNWIQTSRHEQDEDPVNMILKDRRNIIFFPVVLLIIYFASK
jgi:4-hydroxybenzoate polyprenyltransferase